MISSEQLLKDALRLSESERLLLATRLLESLPQSEDELAIDDPGLFEELDRRFSDLTRLVPAADLWRPE